MVSATSAGHDQALASVANANAAKLLLCKTQILQPLCYGSGNQHPAADREFLQPMLFIGCEFRKGCDHHQLHEARSHDHGRAGGGLQLSTPQGNRRGVSRAKVFSNGPEFLNGRKEIVQ